MGNQHLPQQAPVGQAPCSDFLFSFYILQGQPILNQREIIAKKELKNIPCYPTRFFLELL